MSPTWGISQLFKFAFHIKLLLISFPMDSSAKPIRVGLCMILGIQLINSDEYFAPKSASPRPPSVFDFLFSPSVFLLVSEIMALKIRQNNSIQGINVGKIELLLSQFADDMDLYLPFEQTVLTAVINILDIMETNIGFKVSYEKTTIYGIGSIAHTDAKLYTQKQLKWSSSSINTLRVEIFCDRIDLTQNYDHVINKMKSVSEIWYYRNLTISEKVLIINSLMASLFVYRMQMLPPPTKQQITDIDKVITEFLWKGKRAKLSLKILRKTNWYLLSL